MMAWSAEDASVTTSVREAWYLRARGSGLVSGRGSRGKGSRGSRGVQKRRAARSSPPIPTVR